jgi:hypothetical protein
MFVCSEDNFQLLHDREQGVPIKYSFSPDASHVIQIGWTGSFYCLATSVVQTFTARTLR